MKNLIICTAAGLVALASVATAAVPTAQEAAAAKGMNAIEYANDVDACGEDVPVVQADFLQNGDLQVTCPTVFGQTALNSGAAAGIVGAIVVIALVAGDDGTGVTTTTTTTMAGYGN